MNRNTAFYIISVVVIVSLYLFLEPKILPSLFNVRNSSLLNNFIANTVEEKRINTQEFWKMREFYCPGVFTYDKKKNPFLKYDCKWLKSEEFLITYPTFKNKINLKNINILIENNQIQIYKDRQKLYINFIVTGSEMEKAVGVFHYREEDKEVKESNYFAREVYWGAFSRSIVLPQEIDQNRVKATLKKGLLTIILPKKYKNTSIVVESLED